MIGTRETGRAAPTGETILIHARYLVPVRPFGQVLENHSVALRDDVILGLAPREEAVRAWPGVTPVELSDHVLLPGLVNAHTHAPMTLLRGFADDMELNVWLREHIWPAEKQFVGPEFVRDGTRLAIAEMFRSGTTCFNDMYFFPDATIAACRAAGMRVSVGITVIEIESAWARDVDDYIEKGLALHEQHAEDPLVSFTFSPHAPYTVSDQTLGRISELSESLSVPVHMHLLETEWEIKQSFQQHELHPISRLERQGLLNPRLHAVHMTQLSASDIDKFAESGAHVIHCPQSNLKLASGICPLASLLSAGINVALGTDGAASNNDLDMLSEAQTAALLAKGVTGDAKVVNSFEVLDMLTINGARALGLDARVGTIEPGKQADLCALDLSEPETQPLHHVVSQLVYAASRRQFSDVWVAGRRVLNSGRLTTIDLEETTSAARTWQDRLARLNTARPDGAKEAAS
ncbi:MAG: TRZ/ATZ family hydrolase [Lysobacterales bacterium]|jgi:5-methylthioadenosine/S-adenosylhomocysteine deaminase